MTKDEENMGQDQHKYKDKDENNNWDKAMKLRIIYLLEVEAQDYRKERSAL